MNALLLSHNTFFSDTKAGGVFVRVADPRQFAEPITSRLTNNLYVLPGWLSQGDTGATSGNWFALRGMLGDFAALDFGLPSGSPLRGRVGPAPAVGEEVLAPAFEFVLPRGVRPLEPPGKWAPGAFQTPSGR